MLYLLDTAGLNSIEKAFDLYSMSGVMTNSTIISKSSTMEVRGICRI